MDLKFKVAARISRPVHDVFEADTLDTTFPVADGPGGLAEAMRRIHNGESVSVLFEEH